MSERPPTSAGEMPPGLELLGRGVDQVAALIAGTRPDQADLPTPCRSWTVRALVTHLCFDLENYVTAVSGGTPDWTRKPPPLEGDWSAAFEQRRRQLVQAWSSADLDRRVPSATGVEVPLIMRADQQAAEMAVHAWDLARATGQSEDLDAELAEHSLQWAQGMLEPEFRGAEEEGKQFGPEMPVPTDAPVSLRLAGWFGRDPAWARPAA